MVRNVRPGADLGHMRGHPFRSREQGLRRRDARCGRQGLHDGHGQRRTAMRARFCHASKLLVAMRAVNEYGHAKIPREFTDSPRPRASQNTAGELSVLFQDCVGLSNG